jgi:hypothetical protein
MWNGVDTDSEGNWILYFTTDRFRSRPLFGNKKAIYTSTSDRWTIYDVQDNFLSTNGVSSLNGYGGNYIFNDYSLPGWGPAAA